MDVITYGRGVIDSLLLPESEDINLDCVMELIRYICTHQPPGAVLVFLPGWNRISTLYKLMTEHNFFTPGNNELSILLLAIHNKMQMKCTKNLKIVPLYTRDL